ncbi:hypothetical protein CVT25_001297 [Psilocybe cyanescens]|uniref:S5 DRBM domain-containing protein n=1 Tax=Psilocybe cyanescens TaxID=93625 RepID=A0A409XEK5_PSICY|nr:hypothetical protein CVT25_001297 [Psilocybe cyanescens]
MNRLLLLRPVSRAIRVKGSAPCRRDLARAFSSTPCQNLRATSPANKKNKKKLSAVDAEFFGGAVEGAAELQSEARSSKQTAKSEPTQGSPEPKESTSELPSEIELDSELVSNEPIDIEQYYASWFSAETRAALAEHRLDRYAFVSAILESPICRPVIQSFDAKTEEEFEKRWLAFEISEHDDDTGLIPVLEFFLRGGLQLLPPRPDAMRPEECIQLVRPSVAQKALDPPEKGPWQLKGEGVKQYVSNPIPYPDLMTPDRILDPRDVYDFPADKKSPFTNQVIVRNHRSVFHEYPEGTDSMLAEDERGPPIEEDEGGDSVVNALPVSSEYYQGLYHSILMRRPVVQQTGKGKIRRIAYMVLVGDGKGLVGYGEGKHNNSAVALKAARIAAVKNMDWVERFEQRTIWTEMKSKLGATQLILRPRPVGFGLRCNPFLHQILRAAGMKDISAKVWGSRNKLNVIKAAFRMLHAGHAPTGMGDGVGGKGKKLSKGAGVRGKSEIERARGRKLINLRN